MFKVIPIPGSEAMGPDVADTVRNLLGGVLPFGEGQRGETWEWGCPSCGAGESAMRMRATRNCYFDTCIEEDGTVQPDDWIDDGDAYDYQAFCSECDHEFDVAVKVPIEQ